MEVDEDLSRSLPYQIACLRHCVAGADVSDDIRAGAEAGIESLEWVLRNAEVIRTVYRLINHKAVRAVLEAFPGAELFDENTSAGLRERAVSGSGQVSPPGRN